MCHTTALGFASIPNIELVIHLIYKVFSCSRGNYKISHIGYKYK